MMSESSNDLDFQEFSPKDECERTLWKSVVCFHFWESLWEWIVEKVIALHRGKLRKNKSSFGKLDNLKQSRDIHKKQS
jgi:hypothetical protein